MPHSFSSFGPQDPNPHKTSHQLGGSDQLNLSGLPGKIDLVDRGNLSSYDWTVASFIKDDSFHDLDCSLIVPAGALWIFFKGVISHTGSGWGFHLKRKSYATAYNALSASTIAGCYVNFSGLVQCDPNRIVSYYCGSGATWTMISLLIRGWVT